MLWDSQGRLEIMKSKNFENIKTLIIENVHEARSFQDLQARLEIIQMTLNQMKKPKRKLYPVPVLKPQFWSKIRGSKATLTVLLTVLLNYRNDKPSDNADFKPQLGSSYSHPNGILLYFDFQIGQFVRFRNTFFKQPLHWQAFRFQNILFSGVRKSFFDLYLT